jgi:hypothetical protein
MNGRRGFGLGGFGRWRSAFDLADGFGRKCMKRAMTNKAIAISPSMLYVASLIDQLYVSTKNVIGKTISIMFCPERKGFPRFPFISPLLCIQEKVVSNSNIK